MNDNGNMPFLTLQITEEHEVFNYKIEAYGDPSIFIRSLHAILDEMQTAFPEIESLIEPVRKSVNRKLGTVFVDG